MVGRLNCLSHINAYFCSLDEIIQQICTNQIKIFNYRTD
jgi:hypothetical protein